MNTLVTRITRITRITKITRIKTRITRITRISRCGYLKAETMNDRRGSMAISLLALVGSFDPAILAHDANHIIRQCVQLTIRMIPSLSCASLSYRWTSTLAPT